MKLTLGRVLSCMAASAAISFAQSNVQVAPQIEEPPSIQTTAPETGWLDAILNFFGLQSSPAPSASPDQVTATDIAQQQAAQTCSVAAIPTITDTDALSFEQRAGTEEVVDLDGLQPRASRALYRFQGLVKKVGGAMTLHSAYRPAAYQAHLRDVWNTWMALRNNYEASCQNLKAQAAAEFTMHRLLESQHPVPVSDHTRGLAFDANVLLPGKCRMGRRRVTLDSLARMSGLCRPAIAADPIHFKSIG